MIEKDYHAPTGIFTGPLDDRRRRLIHPAVVLINLESKIRTDIKDRLTSSNLRFLENIVLNLFFISTILKRLSHASHTSHTASNACANLGWMHVLV
jgi:hypothetical protein